MGNIKKFKPKREFEPEVINCLVKRLVYLIVFLAFTVVVSIVLKDIRISIGFSIVTVGVLIWGIVTYYNFKNQKYKIIEGQFKDMQTSQDDSKKGVVSKSLFSGYGKTSITIKTKTDYLDEENKEIFVTVPVKYGFTADEESIIRVYFSEGDFYKNNNNSYYITSPIIVYRVEN